MARLDIHAAVTGLNEVERLDKSIDKLEKTTKKSNVSLAKWSVAIGAATTAIYAIVNAGRDYQVELNKINGTTDKLTVSLDNASTSFGQFSQRLMDVSGATTAATTVMKAWDGLVLRATSFITGETIPALIAEQQKIANVTKAREAATAAVKEQIRHEKALNAVWKTSAPLKARIKVFTDQATLDTIEYNKELAEKVRLEKEDAEAMKEKAQQLKNISDQFNYASGMNPAQQQWQATYGEQENTKAVEENTKAVEKQTQEQASYHASYIQSSGAPHRTATIGGGRGQTSLHTATTQDFAAGGYYFGASTGHSVNQFMGGSGSASMQLDTTAGESGEKRQREEEAIQQKKHLAALASVTLQLDKLNNELIDAEKDLYDAQNVLSMVNAGLKNFASELESISIALGTDWLAQAREALYGGTSKSLGYEEAKANAQEAWKLFQTDTFNQEYLDTYNARMSELIGTLEDFQDSSKYMTSQQQEWDKAVALREMGILQDAQLTQQEETDRQLAALLKIVASTEQTDANTLKANSIINDVKSGVDSTVGAVDDVTTATNKVAGINLEIEKKKNERAALENTRWTQIGQATEQVFTGEYDRPPAGSSGSISKIYETVTYPTFGYVNETGQSIGYKSGGYTGNGAVNEVAGMVHGQEYVINAQTTKDLGLNNNDGGVFKEINAHLFEINKTVKRTYLLDKQMLTEMMETA